MDLAGGLKSSTQVDGESFKAVLEDPDQSARPWVFAEHNKKSWVRDQDWKLYHDGRFVKVRDFKKEETIDLSRLNSNQKKRYEQLMRAQQNLQLNLDE